MSKPKSQWWTLCQEGRIKETQQENRNQLCSQEDRIRLWTRLVVSLLRLIWVEVCDSWSDVSTWLAMGCPNSWLFLGMPVRVPQDESSIWVSRLNKQKALASMGTIPYAEGLNRTEGRGRRNSLPPTTFFPPHFLSLYISSHPLLFSDWNLLPCLSDLWIQAKFHHWFSWVSSRLWNFLA